MPSINKVVIFGATGNTGLETVAVALEKGLAVTAFVRDAKKIPSSPPYNGISNVVVGDVTDPSRVDEAVNGQDAVIIALGTRNDLSETTVMSDGTRNILQSMQKFGVNRVSVCLSSFLFWEEDKIPSRMIGVHNDHKRMYELLKASDREWTVMCPPHIDDKPSPGPYKMLKEERVGPVIAKRDLADALVGGLMKDEYLRCRVGLGY